MSQSRYQSITTARNMLIVPAEPPKTSLDAVLKDKPVSSVDTAARTILQWLQSSDTTNENICQVIDRAAKTVIDAHMRSKSVEDNNKHTQLDEDMAKFSRELENLTGKKLSTTQPNDASEPNVSKSSHNAIEASRIAVDTKSLFSVNCGCTTYTTYAMEASGNATSISNTSNSTHANNRVESRPRLAVKAENVIMMDSGNDHTLTTYFNKDFDPSTSNLQNVFRNYDAALEKFVELSLALGRPGGDRKA